MMEVDGLEDLNQVESQNGLKEVEFEDRLLVDEHLQEDEIREERKLEEELRGKGLPTIDEELAKIFPDSAHKFLKPAKKRGRPRKKVDDQKTAQRGRGRPRKTDSTGSSSLLHANKVHKVHSKVGRPRKTQTLEIPAGGIMSVTEKGENGTDSSKSEWMFDNSIELQKLRKKPRLSYVEAYIDDEDEEDKESNDALSDRSFGNFHSEPGSHIESESGFESDSQTTEVKRQKHKKKKKIREREELPKYRILKESSKSKAGLSRYQILKVRLLKFKATQSKNKPTNKLKIGGPKRGKGRPRKDEIQKRTLMVKLERLSDQHMRNLNASYMAKDHKKEDQPYWLSKYDIIKRRRGRPKKSKMEPDKNGEHGGDGTNLEPFFSNTTKGTTAGYSPSDEYTSPTLSKTDVMSEKDKKKKKEKRCRSSHCESIAKMINVRVKIKRLENINANEFHNTERVNTNHDVEDIWKSREAEDVCERQEAEDIGIKQDIGDFGSKAELDYLSDTQSFYLNQEVVSPMLSPRKRGRPKRQDTVVVSGKKRGRPCKENTMPKRPRGRPRKFPKASQAAKIKSDSGCLVRSDISSPAESESGCKIKPHNGSLGSADVHFAVSAAVQSPFSAEVSSPVEPHISQVKPTGTEKRRGRPKGSSAKKKRAKGRPRKISEALKVNQGSKSVRPRGRPKGCKNSRALDVLEETGGTDVSNNGSHDFNIKTDHIGCLATGGSKSGDDELQDNSITKKCHSGKCEMKLTVPVTSDLDGYIVEVNESYSNSPADNGEDGDTDIEDRETVNANHSVSKLLPVVTGAPTSEEISHSGTKLCDSEHVTKEEQSTSKSVIELDLSEHVTEEKQSTSKSIIDLDVSEYVEEEQSTLKSIIDLDVSEYVMEEEQSTSKSIIDLDVSEYVTEEEQSSSKSIIDLDVSEHVTEEEQSTLKSIIELDVSSKNTSSIAKTEELSEQLDTALGYSEHLGEITNSELLAEKTKSSSDINISGEKCSSEHLSTLNLGESYLESEDSLAFFVSPNEPGTSFETDSYPDANINQSGENHFSDSLFNTEVSADTDFPDDDYLLSF